MFLRGSATKPSIIESPPPAPPSPEVLLNWRETIEVEVSTAHQVVLRPLQARRPVHRPQSDHTHPHYAHNKRHAARVARSSEVVYMCEPGTMDGLMKESEEVVRRRRGLRVMVEKLDEADEIVMGV
ncbi:hypothetical protein MSAN_01995600 [Mycena sanguinolenta]|uniref:Uncharacterized protein n=1 Tax=Mycena sanguinolenta TaxID=230812 RepID=A0A8H6XLW3_9AGAR|nr:hypothetical protein MSAN_01995600 [Mycena sanguinolenta]